ncbi:MAG: hypothetical protein ACOVKP_10690, partial [Flavobacterium sp.]
TTSSKTTTEDIILVIDKNTSDAKLKQEAQLLKDQHGINLKISKVKRNANQEITGIKVQFDDNQGKKGTSQFSGDKPIEPITFSKSTDKNGKTSIGLYTGKNKPNAKINKRIVLNSSDDEESNFAFSFSDDEEDLTPPDAPSVPDALDAPDAPSIFANEKVPPSIHTPYNSTSPNTPYTVVKKTISIKNSKNGEKPIVYINGKKVDVTMEELTSKLDSKSIERMDVYKGDISIEKYGDDGKNGVIAITTKDGRTEVNVNKIIKRAQADVERSLNDRENMQAEMERARKEIELSKIEMQKAKAEIEKAKQEILKAKKEIEKAKADTQKNQKK